jgi:hypothetical protein
VMEMGFLRGFPSNSPSSTGRLGFAQWWKGDS